MEELLAACGFSAADLPGERVAWHTTSSACAVLGRLERLVLVGDSVTRQVGPACCGVRHPCLVRQRGAHLLRLCMRGLFGRVLSRRAQGAEAVAGRVAAERQARHVH